MTKKSIEMIVKKRLKRHRTEVVLLWFIIATGVILVSAGTGVYLNVGKLAVVQQVSTIPTRNFSIDEVKMLCDLAGHLGIVFSLTGIAVIVLARERLSLGKSAHSMASHIQKLEEDLGRESEAK